MSNVRVSPSFNTDNPEHKKALEYINSKGRSKADYIAKAILYYEKNKDITVEHSNYVTRDQVIEICNNLLAKQTMHKEIKPKHHETEPKIQTDTICESDAKNILASIGSFK